MKFTGSAKVIAMCALAVASMSIASCGARNEASSTLRVPETPAATDAFASTPDLTGIWTVVGHHIPEISAMSDADAKVWHGRTVRLTANQAISPESHCDEPAYTTDTVTKDRFLGSEFNLRPGSLTPLASLEQISVLHVSCGRERWTAMGGRMIGIDRDRVLAFWDGVFFELARDRDFRAVGQEPFWRLELQKGKEIRFTYALGQREAATPAPVPKIDPVSGSSVYHAVTEANDLRVAIEPTRCADVMSGKPFEKTVTVTLNGQTYRGCGEAVQ